MFKSCIFLIISLLSGNGLVEHPLSHPALDPNGIMNLGVHTVEDSRYTAEEGWLEFLNVINELQGISTIVTMGEALYNREDKDTLLEGVAVG